MRTLIDHHYRVLSYLLPHVVQIGMLTVMITIVNRCYRGKKNTVNIYFSNFAEVHDSIFFRHGRASYSIGTDPTTGKAAESYIVVVPRKYLRLIGFTHSLTLFMKIAKKLLTMETLDLALVYLKMLSLTNKNIIGDPLYTQGDPL